MIGILNSTRSVRSRSFCERFQAAPKTATQPRDADQHRPPPLLHEVGDGDHQLGKGGQVGAKACEQVLELRDHEDQMIAVTTKATTMTAAG